MGANSIIYAHLFIADDRAPASTIEKMAPPRMSCCPRLHAVICISVVRMSGASISSRLLAMMPACTGAMNHDRFDAAPDEILRHIYQAKLLIDYTEFIT